MTRYAVVGGGIVGLATARALQRDRPDAAVTVLEKERRWGAHQTGHNSGVVHAGVYYAPGSLKARLCRAGNASMVEFCRRYDIPVDVCGKLIVAVGPDEVPRLRALHERAAGNGLAAELLTAEQAREYEPYVACEAALRVPETGIVDFAQVCDTLAGLLADGGAELRTGARVVRVHDRGGEVVVESTTGEVAADVLVNCAGLHSDRIAELAGLRPPARIVPFRGEYFQLRPERRSLVRNLIYPVPDPALAFPGMWRLARRHLRYGLGELRRSLSTRRFAQNLSRLVPSLTAADLEPADSGVRAQAVTPGGALVDDFLIVTAPRQVHVLNAPSPAATSALEIAKEIVSRLPA